MDSRQSCESTLARELNLTDSHGRLYCVSERGRLGANLRGRAGDKQDHDRLNWLGKTNFPLTSTGLLNTASHPKWATPSRRGKPRWAETRLRNFSVSLGDYDFAPDGKRLAALVADDAKDEKPLTHLTFLLNGGTPS